MMIFRIDHLAAIAEVEGLVANKLNHAIGHIFKVNLAEVAVGVEIIQMVVVVFTERS